MHYEDILLDKFENDDRRINTDYKPIDDIKQAADTLQVLVNQLRTGTAKLISGEIDCTGDVYTIKVKFTIQ
jgi:hypothetical protein